MSILQSMVVSVAQRAVLKMMSERGGSIAMNLSDESIGQKGREGIKRLATLGLIKLTPLVGKSEHYDVSLTDMGRAAVDQIIKNIKGV